MPDEADDLPLTEQKADPQPYDGPVDSIADFCKLLKAEFQIVGLNKLIASARIPDLVLSKTMVGRHLGFLEACDVVDAQMEKLRQSVNAAKDGDRSDDLEPETDDEIMGRDEDSEEDANYG